MSTKNGVAHQFWCQYITNLLKDTVEDVEEAGTESREEFVHSANECPSNLQHLQERNRMVASEIDRQGSSTVHHCNVVRMDPEY